MFSLSALLLTSKCSIHPSGAGIQGSPGPTSAYPSTPLVTRQPESVTPEKTEPWKPFSQLDTDLKTIVNAGYAEICLFDLKSLRDYPDPRYLTLLTQYAIGGIEFTVFVQDIEPTQETIDLVKRIGITSVILSQKDSAVVFEQAQLRIAWWRGVAYPPNHKTRPQYEGWPDLRSEQVRQDIADWAVQIPSVGDSLVLDYIRWNGIGNGRNAEQVTDLVRRIRAQWGLAEKGTLSAAVFPYLGTGPNDGGALSVGQKWNEWLEDGLLDSVYPMAYISQDIPWLVEQWKPYDKHKLAPCLSVIDYHG